MIKNFPNNEFKNILKISYASSPKNILPAQIQIKINKSIQKKIVNIIKTEDSKIPVDIPNPKFKGPF